MKNNNPMEDIKQLTICAQSHIKKLNSLSQKQLEQKYELPCSCEEVALRDLLCDYECQECGGIYFYSCCWNDVVYEDDTWHCIPCGKCRGSSEWHCKRCNDCTYGLTLECDNCGKKSPFRPE